MHLRLGISPPSHCKDSEKSANESIFRKKIAKKVAELPKKHYICTRNEEDSRIECPNQTITEPVGIP